MNSRERVNPMTQEEIVAWEEILHGMSLEEIAQLVRICYDYSHKWYGFDRKARASRTPEWLAKAAKRLEGQTSTCCECGEEYPAVEHQLYDHVFCLKCRSKESD